MFDETTRIWLPAEAAEWVLEAALRLSVDPAQPVTLWLLWASVALLVDLCAGSRGNMGVHLQAGDVQLLDGGASGHVWPGPLMHLHLRDYATFDYAK